MTSQRDNRSGDTRSREEDALNALQNVANDTAADGTTRVAAATAVLNHLRESDRLAAVR